MSGPYGPCGPGCAVLPCAQVSDDLALTLNTQLSRDVVARLAQGITDPAHMLASLQTDARWRDAGFTVTAIERKMNAALSDTRDLAKRIVHDRAAQTMLEVLDEGEPKDKIQVLAKWGPAVNDDERGGGLTIIVGPSSNVQVNIGLSPQQSKALGESDRNR